MCRIKAKYYIKPQYIVKKSKKTSLYSILSIANGGAEFAIFNFNYPKGSAVTDTAGI